MRAGLWGLLGAALLAAGCGEAPEARPARPLAPLGVQGDVVIEPPELRIGQTALLEVAVVTPPGHRVAAVAAPAELPGLWVLEVETPSVVREPQRWIHRTRFRVRARATGHHVWPAQTLRIETPEGEATALDLPERSLEVVEAGREWPERVEPFGVRRRAAPGSVRGILAPALAGALVALAGVGLVALVRRARGEAEVPREPSDDRGVWRAARATLASAEARLSEDPRAAADLASAGLRTYLSRRFRADAVTATSEELAARPAPWGLVRSWPDVVGLLHRLDGVRFRPREPGASAEDEVRAALREAQAFLGDAPPRVLRR